VTFHGGRGCCRSVPPARAFRATHPAPFSPTFWCM
jgi:hypothetical protein